MAPGTLPGFYVEAIAVAKRGAWPLPLPDVYGADDAHIALYAKMAATPEGFAEYLDRYVYEKQRGVSFLIPPLKGRVAARQVRSRCGGSPPPANVDSAPKPRVRASATTLPRKRGRDKKWTSAPKNCSPTSSRG